LGNSPGDTSAVIARLKPLLEDGLVEINGTVISVTGLGRSFLRIICMAFDEHLADKKGDNPLFSKGI